MTVASTQNDCNCSSWPLVGRKQFSSSAFSTAVEVPLNRWVNLRKPSDPAATLILCRPQRSAPDGTFLIVTPLATDDQSCSDRPTTFLSCNQNATEPLTHITYTVCNQCNPMIFTKAYLLIPTKINAHVHIDIASCHEKCYKPQKV